MVLPAAYGVPIIVCIVSYYIQVKQISVLSAMSKLSSKMCTFQTKTTREVLQFRLIMHRLMRLQRRYGTIQNELRQYTGLVRRCLNISIALYVSIICYITYLLFITETSFQVKVLYYQIYAINIFCLTLLIMRCSAITRHNPRMRLLMIRTYIQCTKRGFCSAQGLLKVCVYIDVKL